MKSDIPPVVGLIAPKRAGGGGSCIATASVGCTKKSISVSDMVGVSDMVVVGLIEPKRAGGGGGGCLATVALVIKSTNNSCSLIVL